MEFRDVIDGMKEQMYESLPRQSDAWQNDVWEGIVRPQYAAWLKKELQKHLSGDLSSDAGVKAFEAVRADLFAARPRDAVDASIASFVPAPEGSDPFDVVEAIELARVQAGYKFYKWASLAQLEEIVSLCERVPAVHAESYAATVNGTIGLLAHSAAALECDVDAKPNYAGIAHRGRLFATLNRFGERLFDAFRDGSPE